MKYHQKISPCSDSLKVLVGQASHRFSRKMMIFLFKILFNTKLIIFKKSSCLLLINFLSGLTLNHSHTWTLWKKINSIHLFCNDLHEFRYQLWKNGSKESHLIFFNLSHAVSLSISSIFTSFFLFSWWKLYQNLRRWKNILSCILLNVT